MKEAFKILAVFYTLSLISFSSPDSHSLTAVGGGRNQIIDVNHSDTTAICSWETFFIGCGF
jgi:hypothetical protein